MIDRLLSGPFKRLRTLPRDTRGAAAMEFAFVAGPLIALILAGIQTSLVFVAQQAVETATEAAGRKLMTGSAQNSSTTQAQFKAIVCGRLPSFMSCANTFVDVRTSSTFALTNTSAPTFTYDGSGNVNNTWSYDNPQPGDIAVVRVIYLWPVVGGPSGFTLANQPGNKRLLMAASVFKTEQFK